MGDTDSEKRRLDRPRATGLPQVLPALSRKLALYQPILPAETLLLQGLQRRIRHFRAGEELAREGPHPSPAFVLESGWCHTFKVMPDGGRQIVAIKVPGDFLGWRTILLRTSNRGCVAITDVVASEVDHDQLRHLMVASPRLATSILWAACRDEAMAVEHLASLGRRDATGRMAHFFLELAARLTVNCQVEGNSYDCPLSQYVLADLLGLTSIHVNRVLRKLREGRLMTLQNGRITILNLAGMIALSGFDRAYLDQNGLGSEAG